MSEVVIESCCCGSKVSGRRFDAEKFRDAHAGCREAWAASRPRSVPPGACWQDSGFDGPTGATFRCELLAGHDGAHECDRGTWGGKATWTVAAPAPPTPETAEEQAR